MSNAFERQLDKIYKSLECRIDFVGQEKTNQTMHQMLWSTGAIAFVVGFIFQSLMLSMIIFGLGFLLCCLTILPPYPQYNENPVKWLEPLIKEGESEVEPKKDR